VKTRHFAQLVALSALWGASFMFLRIASPVFGPNVMAALRIGLATLTLALIMAAMKQRWPWRHWRELTMLGALSVAVPFLLFAWAALRLPAGYSALLNSTAVAPLKLLTSAGPLVSLQPPFYWRSSSAEPLSNACCPRG